MEIKVNVKEEEHALLAMKKLQNMREAEKHCDLSIQIGIERLLVHKDLLCAVSGYFDNMLSHDCKESQSCIVEMSGVDVECVRKCIDFIYTGKTSVQLEKCEQLMHAASLMQLESLCGNIVAFLTKNLTPKLFFTAMKMANTHELKDLEQNCSAYAEKNFTLISMENEFTKLTKDYVHAMIQSKCVKMSADDRLKAALKWTNYGTERSKFLTEFLNCVELSEVSIDYRKQLIDHDPLITQNTDCLRLLCSSLVKAARVGEDVEKRNANKSAVVIFDRISRRLVSYDPRNNVCTLMQEMRNEMNSYDFSAVARNDFIYVLMHDKSVYRLKHSNESAIWEKRSDMIEKHGLCPPATVWSGYIYVLGGHKPFSTSVVERYHEMFDSWSQVTDMPHSSKYSHVLSTKDYIYTFGGNVDQKYVDKFLRFNPVSLKWDELCPMKEPKGYVAAVEFNEMIYVFGGYANGTHLATFSSYDPETNVWTDLKPMTSARSWFRAWAIDDNLYAVGGYSSDTIEKWDPEKNTWEEVNLPTSQALNIRESVKIFIGKPEE